MLAMNKYLYITYYMPDIMTNSIFMNLCILFYKLKPRQVKYNIKEKLVFFKII